MKYALLTAGRRGFLNEKVRYFSACSGIGGFELGLGSQNYECVGFSEIDKYALQIYNRHFPKHKNYGDITQIAAATIPEHDLFVAGFPCQSFSIAGKKGGFDDARGTIIFDIVRLLENHRPKCFLLENVKGLLSVANGQVFTYILHEMERIGYLCEWLVLDSQNFGVAQRRQRIFIIGRFRTEPRLKIFSVGKGNETNSKTLSKNINRVNTLSASGYAKIGHQEDYIINKTTIRNYVNTIDANYYHGPDNHGQRTLINQQPKNPTLIDSTKLRLRKLTPLECERLQGFPDNWTMGLSDTQRYKTLGNAVTVNTVRYAKSLL
jgi:DNA (cytosine-5)-methyltransferase 1